MRKPFSSQTRFDCQTIPEVELNLKCRDEIIPILRGLQHVYGQPNVRDEILHRVAQDVNEHSRHDRGREGLDYWHITVLAAARLGCDLDYDKLQDLAEQHRALRQIMGIGDWQEHIDFNWRRIRDNVCLLKPQTVEAISHCIVTVRMVMDYYGGASYTLRLAEYFDQLLHVLRPDGEVFFVFNGVTDDCSRREVMERVQDRVVSLDDEIRNHRMDALGRKKVRGQDAANLHNTLVLRRDGTVVFLEEWLCGLEAFDAHRFSPATDFYIPIMLRRKPRTTTLPKLEFVEANLATPPYRLFQEVHHRRGEP